jgi:hypothetical protein
MNGRCPLVLALLVAAGLTSPAKRAFGGPMAAGTFRSKTESAPAPASAVDTVGGHLLFHAGGLVSIPFARLDSETLFSDRAGVGLGAAGDLGFGLSRYIALSGWFEYQNFGEASQACGCDGSGVAFGAQVHYHLVQGVRFDPWLSFGAGYRKLDMHDPSARLQTDATYAGLDWFRLGLGGDWYALSQLGFGPYAQLTLGTFTERPARTDASVYAMMTFGFSVSLDAHGK